jgi:hypothetical protein
VSDELWLNNWQLLALQCARSDLVFISAGNYPCLHACLQGSYVCVTTSRDIAALIEFCLSMAQHSVVEIALMPGFTIQPNSELKNPLGCVCSTCWAKEPCALGLASTRNKQMCLQHQGSVALWDLGRCRLQALQSICRANPSPAVSLPSHPVFRLARAR